ncbi:MAG: hypothetical protein R3A11_06680 [Bdellovibrionota bacterium]
MTYQSPNPIEFEDVEAILDWLEKFWKKRIAYQLGKIDLPDEPDNSPCLSSEIKVELKVFLDLLRASLDMTMWKVLEFLKKIPDDEKEKRNIHFPMSLEDAITIGKIKEYIENDKIKQLIVDFVINNDCQLRLLQKLNNQSKHRSLNSVHLKIEKTFPEDESSSQMSMSVHFSIEAEGLYEDQNMYAFIDSFREFIVELVLKLDEELKR